MYRPPLKEIIDFTVNPAVSEPQTPHRDGGIVFVRKARAEEVSLLHELTVNHIGRQVASLEVMQGVHRHNPESLWIIFRSPTPNRADAQIAGYYGFLHLSEAGLTALHARTLKPRDPDFAHLAPAETRPAAVYIWAIVARKLTALTIPLVGKGLGVQRYGGLPFYATAGTMGGLHGLRGYGFAGASNQDDGVGDLFHFYMPGEADKASPNAA
jgi:hypothetical protein